MIIQQKVQTKATGELDLFGAQQDDGQESSHAIPASVVLEMMKRISGCSAKAMKAWF